MKNSLNIFLVIACILSIAILACDRPGGEGSTPARLEVLSVTSLDSEYTLMSDVLTNGLQTEDFVNVVLSNFTPPEGLVDPSPSYDIWVTNYRVDYSRTDGGPVPAPFENPLNIYLPAGGGDIEPPPVGGSGDGSPNSGQGSDANIILSLVRAYAKNQSPLVQLAHTGIEIHCTAQLYFWGVDGNGNGVSATGYIDVAFADWPDGGDITP